MRIHGVSYKNSAVVRVRSQSSNDLFPLEIYVYKDHKIFVTHKLNIMAIKQHIRAIEVDITEEESLC